jgi:hypothetical protein
VTQARNNALQTAAFARRVVCRALTVLGGVAAGTALAWWLSGTAASAETTAPAVDDVPAVVQGVPDLAEPVVTPAVHTLDTATGYVQDPPSPPRNPLTDLGQKVQDATEQFRHKAELPALPCGGEVCLSNERHLYAFDGLGRSDLPGAPAVTPQAPVVTPATPVVAVDMLVPHTAKDRAIADGMSRRGSPAPIQPALPDLPNWPAPLPFAPVGVPTTGAHGAAGNDGDPYLFAVLPWQDRFANTLVAGGIAAATDAATFGRPGSQPGVAPD